MTRAPHRIVRPPRPAPSLGLHRGVFAALRRQPRPIRVAQILLDSASLTPEGVYQRLRSRSTGLTTAEAEARLREHGHNVVAADGRKSIWLFLWRAVINPLVLLLAVLATISFSTGDARAGTVMSLMIVMGVGLRLTQERRADSTAAKLKAMISVTAAVFRDGDLRELPVAELVPGDIVKLAAGDMIPADVRVLGAKDLFVVQGSLTGESFPVEKFEEDKGSPDRSPIERANLAFLGRASPAASRRQPWSRPGERPISGAWPNRWTTAGTNGVRQGRGAVHLADAALHSRHGAAGLRHQRPDQGSLARGVLLRAGRRGGAHP